MTTTLLQPTDEQIDAIAERMASTLSASGGLRAFARAVLAAQPAPVPANCWCETCRPITLTDMRMVLCPTCGNKRCPHATDHRNACTNSNKPGQVGSSYPAAPVPVPLTAIQILGGLMDAGVPDKFFHAFTAGARFAERKHGIAASPEVPK
jgi:hypothetical protein